MSQQTINIGSFPSDGSGDPLRVAFDKINENFAELYTVTGLSNAASNSAGTVTSVANKFGNVTLYVQDVIGAASKGYVDNAVTANISATTESLNSYIISQTDELTANIASSATDLNQQISAATGNLVAYITTISNNLDQRIDNTVTSLNQTIQTRVENLIDAAPATLDTLREIANSIANDPNFSANVLTRISSLQQYLVDQISLQDQILTSYAQNTDTQIGQINATLNQKASTASVTTLTNTVANLSSSVSSLSNTVSSMQTALTTTLPAKADQATTYTKAEVDALILNISSTAAGNSDFGLITEPVTVTDDYGSI